MKYCFGDIVVVHGDEIGVVVKSWHGGIDETCHDVYCRMTDTIETLPETEIQRYMVRHKVLDEQELQWQQNTQSIGRIKYE